LECGHNDVGYISKKLREEVKNKYGGLCAYSGTKLEIDWQIDHIKPIIRNWYNNTSTFPDDHNFNNMIPTQKLINHYKGNLDLESFRTWFLGGLHDRLKKLPKNPKTDPGNYYLSIIHPTRFLGT